MFITDQEYSTIFPYLKLLKHVYDGGSAPSMPLSYFNDVNIRLGHHPYDIGCSNCAVNLCKEIYIEMLRYEDNKKQQILNGESQP